MPEEEKDQKKESNENLMQSFGELLDTEMSNRDPNWKENYPKDPQNYPEYYKPDLSSLSPDESQSKEEEGVDEKESDSDSEEYREDDGQQEQEETGESQRESKPDETSEEKPDGDSGEKEHDQQDESKSDDEDDSEEEKNPHYSERWRKRLKNAKQKAKKQAEEEYKQKIEELERQVQEKKDAEPGEDTQVDESIMEEYKALKRRYDAENDPEIAKPFNERIKNNDNALRSILSKYYGKETVDKIKDVSAYARKNSDEWQEALDKISDVSSMDADALRYKVADNISAHEEKRGAVQEAAKNADQYFEKKQQEQQNVQQQQQQQQEQIKQTIEDYKGKLYELDQFKLRDEDQAENEDQKEQIRWHNQTAKQMREKFDQMLQTSTPEDELEIRAAAAMAYRLKNEADFARKEADKWKSKYEERAKAGQVKKHSTQAGSSQKQPKQERESNPQSTEELFKQAVEQHGTTGGTNV